MAYAFPIRAWRVSCPAFKFHAVKPGDVIAVIAGTPSSRRGTTNLPKVHGIEK